MRRFKQQMTVPRLGFLSRLERLFRRAGLSFLAIALVILACALSTWCVERSFEKAREEGREKGVKLRLERELRGEKVVYIPRENRHQSFTSTVGRFFF
jgi:hypothetical protein